MKTSDVNLKMLLEPRALKLNDILEILDVLVTDFKNDLELFFKPFEPKELVKVFRDISTLTKYMYLSEKDFARKMLSLIHVKGENVDNLLNEYFDESEDNIEEIGFSLSNAIVSIEEQNRIEFKIVDCSKSNDTNLYVQTSTITYDFILKMQSRLWNGILDSYLESIDEPEIHSIQEYDIDFINSIQFVPNLIASSFLKTNIVNWAFAQKLIVTEDSVNVIFDEKRGKVLISIEFSI